MSYNSTILHNHALNASFNSPPSQLFDAGLLSYQLAFTGTCSFTVQVQTSNDAFANPNTYDYYPGGSATITTSGTLTINISALGTAQSRLVFTDNSGGSNTGVVTATVNVKGPGV